MNIITTGNVENGYESLIEIKRNETDNIEITLDHDKVFLLRDIKMQVNSQMPFQLDAVEENGAFIIETKELMILPLGLTSFEIYTVVNQEKFILISGYIDMATQ